MALPYAWRRGVDATPCLSSGREIGQTVYSLYCLGAPDHYSYRCDQEETHQISSSKAMASTVESGDLCLLLLHKRLKLLFGMPMHCS